MPIRIGPVPPATPLFQPATPGEFAHAFRLPPREAADYLAGRSRTRITYDWHELWQDEHARQFTVSRLARADLLEGLRERIAASVNGDLSRTDFMKQATGLLQEAGWWGEKQVRTPDGRIVTTRFNPHRLKLIFEVNTRMAYAAGRWERIQAAKASHPFLRYVTRADEHVRESHRQWHNITLPVDHPWWKTHFPLCGWRCRCRVVAMRASEVERRTDLVRTAPEEPAVEWVNPRTGEVKQVPFAVDPGFAYNVGDAHMRWRQLIDVAREKVSAYQASLGVGLRSDLRSLIQRDWGEWTPAVEAGVERNRLGWLGVISAQDLAHLRIAGVEPLSAEVMIKPGLLRGPKALRHGTAGDALTAEQWAVLPDMFEQAVALMLDTRSGKVVWLLPGADHRPQLAMEVDFVTKRPKRETNAVVSAYQVTPVSLKLRLADGGLRLLWGVVE